MGHDLYFLLSGTKHTGKTAKKMGLNYKRRENEGIYIYESP